MAGVTQKSCESYFHFQIENYFHFGLLLYHKIAVPDIFTSVLR